MPAAPLTYRSRFRPSHRVWPAFALLAAAAARVTAQEAAAPDVSSARSFTIVPTLSVSETLTDNSRLRSSNRQSDLISIVTPRLYVSSSGGRVKGFLDYALNGISYARHSGDNEIQNSLNTAATVEAIERVGYVDVSGNISQRTISAFGTQSTDPHLLNDNRTEESTFSVSPYLRGTLASIADYEARVTQTTTRNDASSASDLLTTEALLRLAGTDTTRIARWSAEASHQKYDFKAGRQNENDRVKFQLGFSVDPQLRLTVLAGHESNNFVSLEKQGHVTSGFGVDWSPTNRTVASASSERRFFGKSHSVLFTHRTPRTVWRFSDTRDVSTGFQQPSLGSRGTIYDLLFSQFSSLQPDPVLRAKLVEDFLSANGIPPTAILPTGSLASAATLERRQDFSFALLGIRDTATLSASQSEARRLDVIANVNDDFANGNLVRQRGLNFDWGHRLTPLSSFDLIASVARTTGTVTSPSNTLRTIGLNWTSRIGPRTSVILGARHAVFRSSVEPYTESALTAQLRIGT